jgi:hypothetical protein
MELNGSFFFFSLPASMPRMIYGSILEGWLIASLGSILGHEGLALATYVI